MEHGLGIDSIVVFPGTVNKRGNLYDMELIAGGRSAFSDLVQNAFIFTDESGLSPSEGNWVPAGIDRGATESKIKIYARLNNDGSITIKTPRRLRTFDGE